MFYINSNRLTLNSTDYPDVLRSLPDPPKQLYVLGPIEALLKKPRLAVVGSRKLSPYGREVATRLVGEAAKAGVVIISGLALGVDGVAHQATLDHGGLTIAVLPGPLDSIYPRGHAQLAQRILQSGGVLVSEYPSGNDVRKFNFIARNRLISGLSNATLITEAADVFFVLGVDAKTHTQPIQGSNDAETAILLLLQSGHSDGDALQAQSGLETALFNQTLTMLETTGKVRSLGANQWALA